MAGAKRNLTGSTWINWLFRPGREWFLLIRTGAWFIIFTFLNSARPVSAEIITIIDGDSNREMGQVNVVVDGKLNYVPVSKIASILDIRTFSSPKVKKIVLYPGDHKIIITAFNPYIIIDEEVHQLPVMVQYYQDDFIIPINYFLQCLEGLYPRHIGYDPESATIAISNTGANISGLEIEDKANGILIRIATTEKFTESKVFTSFSRNWFYVDVYGGRVNENNFPVKGLSKSIEAIVPLQPSPDMARISVRMRNELIDKQIFADGQSKEILVSLRTREEVDSKILENLEKARQKWQIDTIIIDPGHGGKDPGAIGPMGTREKNVTIAIAKKLKMELENKLGVKVLMTRETDTFVPLKDRTTFANKNDGKIFISIHANALSNRRVRGFMTFFLSPAKTDEARNIAQFENEVIRYEESKTDYKDMGAENYILTAMAQNTFLKESQELAAIVQEELNKRLNIKDRGVHQAGFYVLMGASMPNILVETAFLSNRSDEMLLSSSSFQQDVAEAICESIRRFKQMYEGII